MPSLVADDNDNILSDFTGACHEIIKRERALAIPNLSDLAKRVALFGGASHGAGRGIAQGFSEAGASIALVSRAKAKFFTLLVKRVAVLHPRKVRGCCSKRIAKRHTFARSFTNLSSDRGKAVSFCPILMLLVTS